MSRQMCKPATWRSIGLCPAVSALLIASCARQEPEAQRDAGAPPAGATYAVVEDGIDLAMSQKIYVPVYSSIHVVDERRTVELAATLSIRNTDAGNPITITSVRYYDTEGKALRDYVKQPLSLSPMASTAFVVEQKDKSGGLGANFVVEWAAAKAVSEPVVEAVMIGSAGTLGISFVSPGRVYTNERK